jgi:hypothetical protein
LTYSTPEGTLLFKLLSGLEHRYLLCWNGEVGNISYDCGCILTYPGKATQDCDCPCHRRIEIMAHTSEMELFLRAAVAMGEFPFFPASYDERMSHDRKLKKQHEMNRIEIGIDTPCECKSCEFVRKQEAVYVVHSKADAEKNLCNCAVCAEVRHFHGE